MDLSRFSRRDAADFENPLRIWLYRFIQWLCRVYFNLFRGMKVTGRENIPDHSNFILASNHVSNFDPFAVGCVVTPHNTCFLAKRELFEKQPTRLIMDWLGTILVNRKKVEISTIRSAKVALQSRHWCLGIFPEGTRVKDGEPGEAKKGVAFMARSTRAAILPAAIVHDGRRIHVRFGKLIPYEGQDVDTLTEILMSTIETLKREAETRL